jgi:hypothetical protein
MRRKLFSLLLVVVLVSSALSQTAQRAKVIAPSTERLRATVSYLASDKLQGRRTGTEGARAAGRYIAEEFRNLKLKPAFQAPEVREMPKDVAKFMQPFPYISDITLDQANTLDFLKEGSSVQLKVGQDWTPLGFSANGKAMKVSVVFVGYGITANELKYDDYASLDAKGKVALAFARTPDGDNPHGQFARYAEVRFKAITAKDKGAAALVVIANEENFKDDKLSSLKNDYTPNDVGLPVVLISSQAAARMFGLASVNELREIEKRWQTQSEKPSLQNVTLNLETQIVRRNAPAYNIIGILEGSDPKLKNEVIVIGAHYDHLGFGGQGSLAQRYGEIHYGADDNASGIAGLLELARIFSANRKEVRRTIIFIAFSGEEEGLIGSNYYVNHPLFPLGSTVAMINMDMIGRLKDNKLTIGGVGTAMEWKEIVNSLNVARDDAPYFRFGDGLSRPSIASALMSFTGPNGSLAFAPSQKFVLTLNEDGFGPSDHSSFYSKQIPVLFLFTGIHEDYHKPSDTADKVNYEGQASVISYVAELVRSIDRNDKRPTYATAKSAGGGTGRSGGFNVYLGTIPNYADATDGLLLDGVRADSPAEKAGLKAGDKIVKLAGREIKNVYDYTYALGEMKAGVEYEVEVMREGKKVTLKITPSVRK